MAGPLTDGNNDYSEKQCFKNELGLTPREWEKYDAVCVRGFVLS